MNIDLKFLVSDYYATGEGRTISILITRAYSRYEDYKDDVCQLSSEEIALREFKTHFDEWIAIGAEFLKKEEFISRCSKYLSDLVLKQLDSSSGNFYYFSQFHINYS